MRDFSCGGAESEASREKESRSRPGNEHRQGVVLKDEFGGQEIHLTAVQAESDDMSLTPLACPTMFPNVILFAWSILRHHGILVERLAML